MLSLNTVSVPSYIHCSLNQELFFLLVCHNWLLAWHFPHSVQSGIPALGNSKFQHKFTRNTGPVWQIFFQDELKKHMTFIQIYCFHFTAHFKLSNVQKVAIPKLPNTFCHSLWLPLTYVIPSPMQRVYAKLDSLSLFFSVSYSGSHLMFSL